MKARRPRKSSNAILGVTIKIRENVIEYQGRFNQVVHVAKQSHE